MSDPVANRTLELACTVGAIDDAEEALEEGADVNFQGGAPMFLAILNRHRHMVNFLLDHDADISTLLSPAKMRPLTTRFLLVEALIGCAPHDPRNVKPEKIQEVHSVLKTEGIDKLIREIDWDNATLFRDNLNAIGANSTFRTVSEFLHWTRFEHEIEPGCEAADFFVESHEDEISEYRNRYLSSNEDLVALANVYLEEAGNGE
ncbi:MAG: hypothetical protein HKN23_02355 [Verrucomicrobiales bacterium]|nr:hypothetical protein [Verrucomicrobiales bacterium]